MLVLRYENIYRRKENRIIATLGGCVISKIVDRSKNIHIVVQREIPDKNGMLSVKELQNELIWDNRYAVRLDEFCTISKSDINIECIKSSVLIRTYTDLPLNGKSISLVKHFGVPVVTVPCCQTSSVSSFVGVKKRMDSGCKLEIVKINSPPGWGL